MNYQWLWVEKGVLMKTAHLNLRWSRSVCPQRASWHHLCWKRRVHPVRCPAGQRRRSLRLRSLPPPSPSWESLRNGQNSTPVKTKTMAMSRLFLRHASSRELVNDNGDLTRLQMILWEWKHADMSDKCPAHRQVHFIHSTIFFSSLTLQQMTHWPSNEEQTNIISSNASMDSSEPKLYHCSLTFLQNQEKDEAREHGHEKTLYEKKKKNRWKTLQSPRH